MTYQDIDPTYYSERDRRTRESAEIIVPLILEGRNIETMIDVGGGVGTWASVFESHGVRSTLVDSEEVPRESLQVSDFHVRDLSKPFVLGKDYDLALCLEVAEHLPPESAEGFVQSLVDLAPVIVFSAAVPGQSGVHHVNEQFPSYWVVKFWQYKYGCLDILRHQIWYDQRIPFWYRQNILIFAHEKLPNHYPMDVIHPELWMRGR